MEQKDHARHKPKVESADIIHSLVKAGFSAVPVVGPVAAEIFSLVIAEPISKRRDAWIESIASDLKMLEERIDKFKIADVSKDEIFVTTLLHATQAALRSHQKEKLEALRNAVLNAAMRTEPEVDLHLIFLNLVDSLTPWHLRVLQLYNDPQGWCSRHGIPEPALALTSDPLIVLENAFPELQNRQDFRGQIVRDLATRGLIQGDEQWIFAPYTTPIGKRLLAFIASPLLEHTQKA